MAWFICGYKRDLSAKRPTRYCSMDDFTAQIYGEGGSWSETEVLGGFALVKVKAGDTLLATIAATNGFQRIPVGRLDDTLGSLSLAQRNAIKNKILAMGYTEAELLNALGADWQDRTLLQVLRFCATRRLKPRYDQGTDAIILDGPVQSCRTVEDVNAGVPD